MGKRTICFVVCFHENEWVILNVAVEADVWSIKLEFSFNEGSITCSTHSIRQYQRYFCIKG